MKGIRIVREFNYRETNCWVNFEMRQALAANHLQTISEWFTLVTN